MDPSSPRVVGAVLAVWVALSASLIIFNAELLNSFRHPVLLTCWHQFVSVVLILCVRAAFPSLVSTGDPERGIAPLTLWSAVGMGLPVAVCQSIGLVSGNTAIMYLSVAFCQMIKAFTPACVYASGCAFGTQQWSVPIAKCLFIITFGLMVTSLGELNFNLFGFVMQVIALVSEGLRITFLELRLKAQGHKLNALSSVMVFAPMVCVMLFLSALVFDQSAFDVEQIAEIGVGIFGANAVVAFLLNVAIYLAIQCASGLVFTLAGILKDFLIVAGSCALQGTQISTTQLVGYTMALAGLQAYGVVSRSPSDFEDGVVMAMLRKALDGEKEASEPLSQISTEPGEPNSFEDDEESSHGQAKSGAAWLGNWSEDTRAVEVVG
ncbi:unnamed protein product [Prorocentrum cordatum]|uniref:Sugar phosphate transporter domain-containing protein n=1 Tax=Prorocentrum cordatum TaxID=2364126 RepID=A0ABN9SR32_9DINO|nr:unnamed protein product [Polarella glacialis]